ncbi:MAG TPA: DUF2264 domain-containing protein [Tepidisphaeraceae bacterium]|nr:DUF2264 domain-containing protein [Tepidisphaeraceae bacterium]
MNRRDFLKSTAAAVAATTCASGFVAPVFAESAPDPLIQYFLTILDGFLKNARATSATYTVCDFPQGTKLAATLTPSGKSYVPVARMLPAIAEYLQSKVHGPRSVGFSDLTEIVLSIYRTAFDPKHPDYWAEPHGDKPTQRTVESSLVALSLARLGPDFIAKLKPEERANINRWLASCTVIPERTNNHAWFTAINQTTRIKLGKTFPEFKGDESWLFDDLKAMDVLAANAQDGWYSDDPKLTVYDYYNFWTFGNFPLFFSRIAGDLYPDWNEKLRNRAKDFLQNTPYFFASDGSIPLFGRSLLYRFAVLSPMLLAYQQGIWPHSPGLLRRITRLNLGWWWDIGAYDEKLGKLRETLSPQGCKAVTENYIDNGHPYWAMQGFTYLSFPENDPFWTAPEEPLPVEKDDFLIRIPGPKMLLRGTKSSGQVRWLQASNTPRRDYYRDKYNKFVWSSAFPFNVLQDGRKPDPAAPWDQALVFRDRASGDCAARIFPDSAELLDNGVRTVWTAKLPDSRTAHVTSAVRLLPDDFELRTHDIQLEGNPAKPMDLELCDGSHALGLGANEQPEIKRNASFTAARSNVTGRLVATWNLMNSTPADVVHSFDPAKRENINLVSARSAVLTHRQAMGAEKSFRLAALYYASPKPFSLTDLEKRGSDLVSALRASD